MAKNQSTEDYIKGIYKLQQPGKGVSTRELAKHLNIGDGSVTGMLKKLSAKKLIRYRPYKGVFLAERGRTLALQMIRRHRLWEMFLVEHLGYRWDEIHDEAERLEHVTSDEMERRIDKVLGYPKVDPHGEPIPSAAGEMETLGGTPLSEASPGEALVLVRVADDPGLLLHASSVGLTLNTRFTVKTKLGVDGSMLLTIGSAEHYVSREVATSIFVERVA
jgi:DtxR family Mn-dependent transcriptional regulator